MVIFLNKYSNNGRGFQRWKSLKNELEEKISTQDYSLISDIKTFKKQLDQEYRRGKRIFIAAGGDGTVNFLANHIMQMKKEQRRQVILGAVGLGSSNDFHKPFSRNRFFTGRVPFRLDHKNAVLSNAGQVDFVDEKQKTHRKYFILNSSIGIIAQANYLFNSKEKVVYWLKPKWVNGTIWYAALKTLFTAPNLGVKIILRNKTFTSEVTNLSILINPNVSGDFCYDLDVSPKSDSFGIALCEEMGGLPLELDGEVHMAKNIRIKLIKGAIKVCQ
jgi:diacylglycerol kinase family enzyme